MLRFILLKIITQTLLKSCIINKHLKFILIQHLKVSYEIITLFLCIFLTTKSQAPRKKCNRSFPDPYSSCVNQGTIVDRIDYNIQNVSTSVEEGYKQLQKV